MGEETTKPPTWSIHVALSSTGVIMHTYVYHHGKEVATRHTWTDHSTLEEVVTWANRAAACDIEFTAKHLVLV